MIRSAEMETCDALVGAIKNHLAEARRCGGDRRRAAAEYGRAESAAKTLAIHAGIWVERLTRD